MSKVFEKITEKSRAELKIFPRVPKISKITKNLRDSKKVPRYRQNLVISKKENKIVCSQKTLKSNSETFRKVSKKRKVLKKAPKDSDKVLELPHKISKFNKTKKFRKVPKKFRRVPKKSRELPKQSRGSEKLRNINIETLKVKKNSKNSEGFRKYHEKIAQAPDKILKSRKKCEKSRKNPESFGKIPNRLEKISKHAKNSILYFTKKSRKVSKNADKFGKNYRKIPTIPNFEI